MKTDEIRTKFLEFFKNKEHKVFISDNLVPSGDRTVLFTSAGMNQFKPYFLGTKNDIKRAASSQKCLRTDDLEKVGKTSSHHTFFEMLGNFSFGDYFKEDAIVWAWEFIVEIIKIPKNKLWISVYEEDEDSFNIWISKINFPQERIVKLAADKNFWPADAIKNGPNGLCGPCSEIFYDLGESYGCSSDNCDPGCDCGRFIEIWNLVFTQFNRKEKNGEGFLEPLPTKNIDTGMGLERVASVLQGVDTNFKIDIFIPIVKEIDVQIKNSKSRSDLDVYAIADHIRAVSFAIAEGVLPSNEEKGYVVRKIIRKAVWHGYKMGLKDLFLYKLVAVVSSVMKAAYPELEKRCEYISSVVKSEEERFQNTIDSGLMRLNDLMDKLKKDKKDRIAGEDVFKLYDTFGFPYELTRKVAQEEGFKIDLNGFNQALDKQKERSKSSSQMKDEIFSKDKELLREVVLTDFIGYEDNICESQIAAIFNTELNESFTEVDSGEAVILTAKTPFYGKGGGQAADKGKLSSRDFIAEVFDVKNVDDRVLHFVKIIKGKIRDKSKVFFIVDKEQRLAIARNHTATHLLHVALREVLGAHIEQAGSSVGPHKLRFDFNHFKALSSEEIEEVENEVNKHILANLKVNTKNVSFEQAKKEGAMALFSEKYGDKVRVVDILGVSKELCGGTHVDYTGDIGLFKIISETSSSGGVRRVEAITAREARTYFKSKESTLKQVLDLLTTTESKVVKEVEGLMKTVCLSQEHSKNLEKGDIDKEAEGLIIKSEKIEDLLFIVREIDGEADYISLLSDKIKTKSKNNTIIMLYSFIDGKVKLVLSLTKDLAGKGFDARVMLDKISTLIDGGGGGRAEFVKAGGKDITRIKEAIDLIRKEIGDNL
ncbi:MAG: alanine--tRNA ligase [Candidatus Kaelpia aquatica]|nr:alanine--tRNA ligase [Candidatus Kaelpia aquatica]